MGQLSNKLIDEEELRCRIAVRYDAALLRLLECIGRAADNYGAKAYLVGGLVRDLFVDVAPQSIDLDIMLDRDAMLFISKLMADWEDVAPEFGRPLRKTVFPRYLTGKILFDRDIVSGISAIDFSTARTETYTAPGARPEISPADLFLDMARRDFSLSALAVGLSGSELFRLYDYFDGLGDISAGLICVLHQKSFADDPARLIRAARFAGRFGFALERETAISFSVAVRDRYLSMISRERLLNEFCKALADKDPVPGLLFLDRAGLLSQIDSGFLLTQDVLNGFRQFREQMSRDGFIEINQQLVPSWQAFLLCLTKGYAAESFVELIAHLKLSGEERQKLALLRR